MDWQICRFRPLRLSVWHAAAFAAVLLVPAPSWAQQFTMKFTTLTLNDMQHEFIKTYKTELEKATNGRIQVGVYPAAQLGGAPRQTEGLRLGTIEAAIGPGELFVGADPRFGGIALAGLFNDFAHARRVTQLPEFRKAVTEMTASRGVLTVALNVYDMQAFVFRAPVTDLKGFAGKRTRVLASEGEQAMINALGAAAVPMSLPEVVPALQQGAIDGVNAVLGVYVAFKYFDVAPNLVNTNLWPLISMSLVSRAWYDRLPSDLQKAVLDTAAKVEPEMDKWQAARLSHDMNAWKAAGGKVATLSPADQAEAQKRTTAAIQPILAKNAPLREFYGRVKAAADSVR